MQIKCFAQSGCVITSDSGYRIALDIGSLTQAADVPSDIDAWCVSHIHGDHFSPEHIATSKPALVCAGSEVLESLAAPDQSQLLLRAEQSATVGPLTITPYEVDHGPHVTKRPRENFSCLIQGDGVSVYVCGDMYYVSGLPPSKITVDVLLVPVGGWYTFGPTEAVAFCQSVQRVHTVIPVHYALAPETKVQFLEHAAVAGLKTWAPAQVGAVYTHI